MKIFCGANVRLYELYSLAQLRVRIQGKNRIRFTEEPFCDPNTQHLCYTHAQHVIQNVVLTPKIYFTKG